MTSKEARTNDLFLRNRYFSDNKWGIPFLHNQNICVDNLKLLGFDNSKSKDIINKDKTIHFFIDDYKFQSLYYRPKLNLNKLRQYNSVMTPDFSLYSDMPIAKQIDNVFKKQWCGAYWQSQGLKVIPTISWSTYESYEFCFSGVEKGSVVAISTVGSRKVKDLFLSGYNEMIKRINPNEIICYGKPFEEIANEVIFIDYLSSKRGIC